MTLQQLKYFIEITARGSISEAAKTLFISQPSLSNALRELEDELQLTLLRRTNRGIALSPEGAEFLGYARAVVEQAELLESRYIDAKPFRHRFSVSTQHYSFCVSAFVSLTEKFESDEYDFTLRETRTNDIIEDVRNLHSELGVIYMSRFNANVISRILKENGLVFTPLFIAPPHIFISGGNPLARQSSVTLEDLEPYPYLSFEQGSFNSFYFSEELLSSVYRKKCIYVSDRATLFNLLIGLNGYTISSGVISSELNGPNIISVPLEADEEMKIGWISHKNTALSRLAEAFLDELKAVITASGHELIG